MRLPLIFRRPARIEFDEATDWYEARRSGLGADFVAEVRRVLEIIVAQPDRFPIEARDVRAAPLSRFPYCIYYRVRPQRVVVIAVFHTSRDPAVWQSRN